MFSKVIKSSSIPPNFLNSILTNPSLYEMFKTDYDANIEYFQGLEKEEYLSAMLSLIESTLFSSNIFNIYTEPEDLDAITEGKLAYIKNFYDDFLLDEFRVDPDSILKTKFFRGMVYAQEEDIYASSSHEFQTLYQYVFKESLDYSDIVEVLIKEPTRRLAEDETLSMKEFTILCNYVKNNINGQVPMNIVTKMLKNHAYKTNHIFELEVVESLVTSIAKSYLSEWNIPVEIAFLSNFDLEDREYSSGKENTIIIDENLIDEFLSLNYTEIFTSLFTELEHLKSRVLLERNDVTYDTLKTIMNLVVCKVDLSKLYIDESYTPNEYCMDLEVSSFVKTLRFFESFGVNLFQNFNESQISKLELDYANADIDLHSYKEISIDQRFFEAWKKIHDKASLVKKYAVLGCLFDSKGNRLKTIDLIKKWMKTSNREFIEEYLHSRIITPEIMIEDVIDLANYKPKDSYIREFLERQLKYIYVDSFYYSLDSYLKLKHNPKFDKDDYLIDLSVKINCIKDTPLTHRFIDEAIFTIEETKQNA